MAGLVPAIHVDPRDKPGDDEFWEAESLLRYLHSAAACGQAAAKRLTSSRDCGIATGLSAASFVNDNSNRTVGAAGSNVPLDPTAACNSPRFTVPWPPRLT